MDWTAELAYVVGLITTDGSLSADGRHLNFTSKDLEQVENFIKILELKNKIGLKSNGHYAKKIYYQVQFGNVKLYRFLLTIGLTPNKTKSLKDILVPNQFFADFLRGHLDGDGTTYSYFDPRWKSSFMFYVQFVSASITHIKWLQKMITEHSGCVGRIKKSGSVYLLTFAKKESIILSKFIYYQPELICLTRKRLKIEQTLCIINP